MRVTFHRAFDVTRDLDAALEAVIAAGADILLTSGGAERLSEGVSAVARLVERAGDRIEIMGGSGVRLQNAVALYEASGVAAIHSSMRRPLSIEDSTAIHVLPDALPPYEVREEDVRALTAALRTSAGKTENRPRRVRADAGTYHLTHRAHMDAIRSLLFHKTDSGARHLRWRACSSVGSQAKELRQAAHRDHQHTGPRGTGNSPGSAEAARLEARKKSYTVKVAGSDDWVDTGLVAAPGDSITVTGTGTVLLSDGRNVTADGSTRGWKDLLRQFPDNSSPVGALVARIGRAMQRRFHWRRRK